MTKTPSAPNDLALAHRLAVLAGLEARLEQQAAHNTHALVAELVACPAPMWTSVGAAVNSTQARSVWGKSADQRLQAGLDMGVPQKSSDLVPMISAWLNYGHPTAPVVRSWITHLGDPVEVLTHPEKEEMLRSVFPQALVECPEIIPVLWDAAPKNFHNAMLKYAMDTKNPHWYAWVEGKVAQKSIAAALADDWLFAPVAFEGTTPTHLRLAQVLAPHMSPAAMHRGLQLTLEAQNNPLFDELWSHSIIVINKKYIKSDQASSLDRLIQTVLLSARCWTDHIVDRLSEVVSMDTILLSLMRPDRASPPPQSAIAIALVAKRLPSEEVWALIDKCAHISGPHTSADTVERLAIAMDCLPLDFKKRLVADHPVLHTVPTGQRVVLEVALEQATGAAPILARPPIKM